MALKGIDVSTFQGRPNWKKVKLDGVDFAMIKATQGRSETSNMYLFTDSKFAYNIKAASDEGIQCGTYHYFTAKTSAEVKKEAQCFIKAMHPYKKYISLYAAVDVESKHLKGLSKNELTGLVLQFCDYVRAAGYTPIVYTNPDWLRNRLNGIGDELLWLALWRDKHSTPTGYKNMVMWQWGGESVNGIVGKVDSDFGYFDLPSKYFPKINYIGTSIVDALSVINAPTSFAYRRKIAIANGISGYIGTAAQNTKLLNLLKQGKLIKP